MKAQAELHSKIQPTHLERRAVVYLRLLNNFHGRRGLKSRTGCKATFRRREVVVHGNEETWKAQCRAALVHS